MENNGPISVWTVVYVDSLNTTERINKTAFKITPIITLLVANLARSAQATYQLPKPTVYNGGSNQLDQFELDF